MLNGQQTLVSKFEAGCLKREGAPKFLNEKCTLLGFLILLTLLFISTGIHMEIEDWTFLEGFYCYFITFTTVGFGDLIPGQSRKKTGDVVLRIILIILGLVAMSNMLIAIANCHDAAQLFKKLKACCGKTGSVEIGKQDEDAGMELKEQASK